MRFWCLFIAAPLLAACASRPAAAVAPASPAIVERATPSALALEQAESTRVRLRAAEIEVGVLVDALADPTAPRGVIEAKKRDLETKVEAWRKQAAMGYATFVDDPSSASSPSLPRAMFELARTLEEQGDRDAAARRYHQLLDLLAKQHRQEATPRLGELAHLSLAEIAFGDRQLDDTLAHCDAVLAATKDSSARIRALYLRSWSLRGLAERAGKGADQRALESLREIVMLADEARGKDVVITASAEHEIVDLYARAGDPKTADTFFSPMGEKAKARMLSALRDRYDRPQSTSSRTF